MPLLPATFLPCFHTSEHTWGGRAERSRGDLSRSPWKADSFQARAVKPPSDDEGTHYQLFPLPLDSTEGVLAGELGSGFNFTSHFCMERVFQAMERGFLTVHVFLQEELNSSQINPRIVMTGAFVCAQSLQQCPTLCDPMDCSPLGSCVRGILQARILEWVARPSSRGSS